MQNRAKLLFFCSLLLTSCNANNVSFKNNLKFDKLLGDAEQQEVFDFMEEQADRIVSIELNATSESETAFSEVKQEATTKYEFFTNGGKTSTSFISNNKRYGVSYQTKRDTSYENWLLRFGGETKLVSCSMDSDKDQPTFNIFAVDNYEQNKFATIFSQLIGNQSSSSNINPSLYQDGKGYALVYSKQTKEVNDVAVGSSTKEYIVSTNSQLVCRINEYYRITSITYYEDYSTNRDPETNEWYKKEKVLSTTKASGSVTYGVPTSKDDASLYKLLSYQRIIWGIKPIINTAYYENSMGQVPSSIFEQTINLTNTTVTYSDVDIVDYHTTLVLSNLGDAKANAFIDTAELVVGYLSFEGYHEKRCEFGITPTSIYNVYTSSVTTDSKIFYYPSSNYGYPYSLNISCRVNAVSNIKITDVSVY